ncbi:MAG: phage Gp37/Gp68 family protein [Pseudomonadota bacterium]|nr:phage Gp37/Gp68 family protein [Pseudomonadota bacterium]
MSDGTKIEWTEATWNPITGCSVTSPGCTNCYAMKLAGTRLRDHPSRVGLTAESKAGPVWTGETRFNEEWLGQPLRWKRPRMIFVCAHGDLFHESVPDDWIDRVFAVMALAPQHTFQVLTKRADRMRAYLSSPVRASLILDGTFRGKRWVDVTEPDMRTALGNWPLPNVWLGVSVEDQQRADERIPDLLATPAAVRWLSCEPLLGPVDLTAIPTGGYEDGEMNAVAPYTWEAEVAQWRDSGSTDWRAEFEDWYQVSADKTGPMHSAIDWIVAGGESGPGARPMQPDWARSLRDQCAAASVPFFFKQWGNFRPTSDVNGEYMQRASKKEAGRLLDGRLHDEMPSAAA